MRPLAAIGIVSLVLGASLTLLVAALSGSVVSGAVAAALLLGWAAVRLIIMRLAAGTGAARDALERAALPALVPFAVAVIAPLDIVALLLSWLLTYKGMRGQGVGPREALLVTGVAFGGQLAVVVAAWLARGALFVGLARI